MPSEVSSRLLTRPEAATALHCSVRMVRYLQEQGRLPTTRVGTRCYVPRVAIDKYIAAQTTNGAAKKATPRKRTARK